MARHISSTSRAQDTARSPGFFLYPYAPLGRICKVDKQSRSVIMRRAIGFFFEPRFSSFVVVPLMRKADD